MCQLHSVPVVSDLLVQPPPDSWRLFLDSDLAFKAKEEAVVQGQMRNADGGEGRAKKGWQRGQVRA